MLRSFIVKFLQVLHKRKNKTFKNISRVTQVKCNSRKGIRTIKDGLLKAEDGTNEDKVKMVSKKYTNTYHTGTK